MVFTPNETLLIIIILATFILIFSGRIATELVALLVLLTLGFTGLVSTQQALSGFSSSVVITLLGLFVITKTLEEVGIIQWIAEKLNAVGKGSEVKLISLFMATGAGLSLVMNNVAAGAVLLPAAVRVAQISNVRASKLLIPMSFGTLVGGMATYLTTANIVMSELLLSHDLAGLGMLDFIPTGGLIVLASLLYMLLIGRRLLPDRDSLTMLAIQTDLQETYQLDERMWEFRVLSDSRLINKSLRESNIGEILGVTVLAIWHGQNSILSPTSKQVIRANDILLVLGRKERVNTLLEWGCALIEGKSSKHNRHDFNIDLIEVIVPPRSKIIGQTLTELELRSEYGVTAIALWREGRSYRTDVGRIPLQVGDALLVAGRSQQIDKLTANRYFLIPMSGYSEHPIRLRKAIPSLIITAVVLMVAILDLLPIPEVMLAGAVAMVLTRCITMQEFYEAVEWRVIFLIAGILPLSIAIAETGLADRMGTAFVNILAGNSPLILIGGMFLLTVLVTQIIGGQVAALLLGPIAINTALQLSVNPQAMSVAVAIACSTAFLTPIAHPVNILMMGPGGYKFGDFFRVGLGMTLITLVTLLFGLAFIWGIH